MANGGRTIHVNIPRLCDLHKRQAQRDNTPADDVPVAEYDCRLKTGTWANVCGPCREEHGMYPDELGIGKGQKIEYIGSHGHES